MHASPAQTVPPSARRSSGLSGRIRVPGDGSVAHLALILGLLSVGETRIDGLPETAGVLATAEACRRLGAGVERVGEGAWRVRGVGVGGLLAPLGSLDFGDAGLGARLMMGVVAGHGVTASFDGDASLRARSVKPVLAPLLRMGAEVVTGAEGGRLPLTLRGAVDPVPIRHVLSAAPPGTKAAVLLAGLNAPGETTVVETLAGPDHAERLLRHFGAEIETVPDGAQGRRITLRGRPTLKPAAVTVPADPAAAFPLVAALVVPGSDVLLEHMTANPPCARLVEALRAMGADIAESGSRLETGETVADLRVRHSALKGVTVSASRLGDDYPLLAVAAAFARGETRLAGLAALDPAEQGRVALLAAGLAANGVDARIEGDDLVVTGTGGMAGGASVATPGDARLAMTFLVAGLAAHRPVAVDDAGAAATRFSDLIALMRKLGAFL